MVGSAEPLQSTNVSCALQEIIERKYIGDKIDAVAPNESVEDTEDVEKNAVQVADEISAATDLLYVFFGCQILFQILFAISIFLSFYNVVLLGKTTKLFGYEVIKLVPART
jgi:hypothetical protein